MLSRVFDQERVNFNNSKWDKTWNEHLATKWIMKCINEITSKTIDDPDASEAKSAYITFRSDEAKDNGCLELMYGPKNAESMYKFIFSLRLVYGPYASNDDGDVAKILKDYFSLTQYEWLVHATRIAFSEGFYRDHLLHPIYVTALGAFLLNNVTNKDNRPLSKITARYILEQIKAGTFHESLTKSASQKQRKSILSQLNHLQERDALEIANTAWEISGLYHDMGYYLQNLKDVYLHKCKRFKSLPSSNKFPPDDLSSKTRQDKMKVLFGHMNRHISLLVRSTKIDLKEFKRAVTSGDFEKCMDFFAKKKPDNTYDNHAFWSAAEMLSALEGLPRVSTPDFIKMKLSMLIAASAIAKHHVKVEDLHLPLSFQLDPIFFMLRLLDGLQENSRISLSREKKPKNPTALIAKNSRDSIAIEIKPGKRRRKELNFTLRANNKWWSTDAGQGKKSRMLTEFKILFSESHNYGFPRPLKFEIV